MTRLLRTVDRPVVIAFCFIVALLALGGVYNRQFLSGLYLLQQLRVASRVRHDAPALETNG
jgi:hypothetical protein